MPRNIINLRSPLQRFYFGVMWAGMFGVFTYLANLEHTEDVAVHDQLLAETSVLGRSVPGDAPEGMPVLVTFDVSGEKKVCDKDLGWCLQAVAYQRDVETRVRTRSTSTRRRDGREYTVTTHNILWQEHGGNPSYNPEPFPGIRFARAVSDSIDTDPRWKLSEEAMEALLHRPGAVLTDREIDAADTKLGYAGEGWWRPNAPDDPELGEQRMRVRTVSAGSYTLLAAVEDGRLVPAEVEGRDVLLAAEGRPTLTEIAERKDPDPVELTWKMVILTGLMSIGVCIALSAFLGSFWLIAPVGLVLSGGIAAALSILV